jgi:hypothetical protein
LLAQRLCWLVSMPMCMQIYAACSLHPWGRHYPLFLLPEPCAWGQIPPAVDRAHAFACSTGCTSVKCYCMSQSIGCKPLCSAAFWSSPSGSRIDLSLVCWLTPLAGFLQTSPELPITGRIACLLCEAFRVAAPPSRSVPALRHAFSTDASVRMESYRLCIPFHKPSASSPSRSLPFSPPLPLYLSLNLSLPPHAFNI